MHLPWGRGSELPVAAVYSRNRETAASPPNMGLKTTNHIPQNCKESLGYSYSSALALSAVDLVEHLSLLEFRCFIVIRKFHYDLH